MALKEIDAHFLDDLLQFIETLRLQGYLIGTDQLLSIQELVLRLIANGKIPKDIKKLYSYLSPLVCTSPDQQADFKSRFDDWIYQGQPPILQKQKSEPLSQTEKEIHSLQKKSIFLVGGWICLVLLICAIGLTIFNFSDQSIDQANVGQTDIKEPEGYDEPTRPPANPLTSTFQTPITPVTAMTPVTAPMQIQMTSVAGRAEKNIGLTEPNEMIPWEEDQPFKENRFSLQLNRSLFVALFVMIIMILGIFVVRWWRLTRAALHLKHRYDDAEIKLSSFFVKEPSPRLFQSVAFFRTAQQFKKHQRVLSSRLDIQKTVNKTVENGGYYTPVMGYSVQQPEYLILIDRMTLHDHQTDLINALVARLVDNDVNVTRYYFDENPRNCIPADGNNRSPVNLSQMHAAHPNHQLIIFSNGKFLIHPITGELSNWLDQFTPWSNRAILLTDIENANEFFIPFTQADFMIMPADESGMALLIDQWQDDTDQPTIAIPTQGHDHPHFFEWSTTRLFSNYAPDETSMNQLIAQLKSYLDPKGYDWLCACAVYPGLIWNLTLYLGYQVKGKDRKPIFDVDRLKQLIRLPWFRYGRMPDWLRKRLIKDMPRKKEKTVRKALFQLFLSADENPVQNFALEYAIKKAASGSLAKAFFRRIHSKKQKSTALQDHIFVTFMRDNLSVKLPKLASIIRPTFDKPLFKQWSVYVVVIALISTLIWIQWSKMHHTWTDPITNMEFVWVPGGCFSMGQTKNEYQYLLETTGKQTYQNHFLDERPQHEVCVDSFWMGTYEVTQAAYQKYRQSTDNPAGFQDMDCNGPLNNKATSTPNHPVTCIHWEQAKAFLEWLILQHKGEYTFRLPTEAEWEYAARAGTQTMRYWGDSSNTACEYANVADQSTQEKYPIDQPVHECSDSFAHIAPVGQFKPNDFGLYDMLGNVWEWSEDNYNALFYKQKVASQQNPMYQINDPVHTLRGGGWYSGPAYVRSAIRDKSNFDIRHVNVGFRVVRLDRQ
jgi:formylglycine-generating enzyme required for sulfatase activity